MRLSDDADDVAWRFRSLAHHTDGFDDEESAWEFVESRASWKCIDVLWEWDGEGIPTVTIDVLVDALLEPIQPYLFAAMEEVGREKYLRLTG